MRLNRVFQRICAKVITSKEIFMFKEDVATTICMLEMVMLPFFFDVMIHLVIHLVEELDLCGLIHTQWMYYIE